jgi:hypothetical protein
MLDRPTLRLGVYADLLIVTDPVTRFFATFSKHPELTQLILQRSKLPKKHPLVEQARKSAAKQARESGWIV